MKTMKKVLPLLLCMVLVVMAVAVTAVAANGASNASMKVSATEVNVGDKITVTVSYSNMTVSSFGCTVKFDKDLLECESVVGPYASMGAAYERFFFVTKANVPAMMATVTTDVVSTAAEANAIGQVGFTLVGTSDVAYAGQDIFIATFVAKAAGTATFTLSEDSAGADGFKGNGSASSVVIKAAAPACTHETTKLVPNDNGTHNVVCVNAECNHVVDENVTCTGTDDGDCTTAVICECGNIVTAAKDSHTGGEATCAKRAECTECGQEYGELNANNHKDTYIAEGFYPDSSDDAYHYQWLACNDCTNKTIEKVNREKHDDKMGDGDHNCDKCGETCSFHTGGTATCTAKAECTECGAEYGNFANHEYMHPCDPVCCICYEVTNPDATHSIIQVEAKAGTDCQTYDGNIEYWYCEHCGAAWLDEECTSPTNTLNVKVAGEHTYTYDCDTNCKVCEELTRPEAKHEGGTATCQNQAVCEDCNKPYGEKNADNHTQELKYVNKGENHVSYYPCCQTEANGTTENHTYGEDTHKCICDAVETFTLTVMDMEAAYSGNYPPANKIFTVPYGTNILDYIKEQIDLGNVDMSNQTVNDETRIGTYIFDGDWRNISAGWGNVEEDSIVSGDTRITVGADFTGWIRVSENSIWGYQNRGHNVVGWYEIEGDWYYFFKTEESNYNFRAEGLTRVPYPTEPINGKTYAPNAEDLAYADFIDATEAWFVFGEDGKFQFDMTEIMDGKYVENGMIPWHPGFVTVEENVYYFCGDVDYGGNKMVTGWYYATRGGESGKYYFGLDGVLVKNHGVAEVEGVLYYFENGKLMQGKGLLKTDKGFIYVRTSGQLAIGKYYISNTANYGGDELGYGNGVFFGADGYALQGIVDGKYYINGRVAYGAGVVEVEEGKYIYVRSNGELVKNTTYWITNVGETGVVAKDYAFDKNGCFVPEFVADQKNGIVEEDGVLYYYENGNIVYGAGLTEIDGDIYYVRSNGQVATGEYWITNTNGLLEAGKYNFGTDGKLITE